MHVVTTQGMLFFFIFGVLCNRLREHFPSRARSISVLNLFFVFTNLTFHAMHNTVDGTHQVRPPIVRDEIVLVLSRNPKINRGHMLVLKVNCQMNGGQAIKDPRDFHHFRFNLLATRLT